VPAKPQYSEASLLNNSSCLAAGLGIKDKRQVAAFGVTKFMTKVLRVCTFFVVLLRSNSADQQTSHSH